MGAKIQSWWQRIKQHPVRSTVSIGAGLLGIALLVAFIGGYFFHWDWTGFGSYTPPTKDSNFQRGKTLWDWLQLLIIPLALAIIAIFFNRAERKNEQRIASDNQQEAALQEYINEMSLLLLEKHLRESKEGDEVRKIARIRTLTVLRGLDKERKGSVLRFLLEAGLINKDKVILDLSGADFREADLIGADLSQANLGKVNLIGADLSYAVLDGAVLNDAYLSYAYLSEAILRGADLSGASLRGAYLSKGDPGSTLPWLIILSQAHLSGATPQGANLNQANLNYVDLTYAYLSGADLSQADLSGAILSEANLSGAIVTEEQLKTVGSLDGATMPDGSKHP